MFTDPDEISQWGTGDWYDHIDLDIDFRVGGVIHHRVTSKSDGAPWTFHGVYEDIADRSDALSTPSTGRPTGASHRHRAG